MCFIGRVRSVTRAKRNMNYHRVYPARSIKQPASARIKASRSMDLHEKGLSSTHAAHLVLRSGNRQAPRVFDKQFRAPCGNHRRALQKALAGRTVFKWIKQNLRIKHFYGTSENAVKTQIWTAVCVYVLAAIIKRELALNVSLNTFLQILSVHSFEKIELFRAFQDVDTENPSPQSNNQ